MDEYKITLTLDNRISVPVTFRPSPIKIIGVRASGVEMPSGFVDLPEFYEVQPGKVTIVMQSPHAPTTFHGFGEPVTAFKLAGEMTVENSYPDQLSNRRYCKYQNIAMAPPFRGSWGS
jgi:hypothetical protein